MTNVNSILGRVEISRLSEKLVSRALEDLHSGDADDPAILDLTIALSAAGVNDARIAWIDDPKSISPRMLAVAVTIIASAQHRVASLTFSRYTDALGGKVFGAAVIHAAVQERLHYGLTVIFTTTDELHHELGYQITSLFDSDTSLIVIAEAHEQFQRQMIEGGIEGAWFETGREFDIHFTDGSCTKGLLNEPDENVSVLSMTTGFAYLLRHSEDRKRHLSTFMRSLLGKLYLPLRDAAATLATNYPDRRL